MGKWMVRKMKEQSPTHTLPPSLPVQGGNIDKCSHGLLSGGGNTDSVQPAGQEAGLDLHDLLVYLRGGREGGREGGRGG